MKIKPSHHYTRRKLEDFGHDIPREDIELAVFYPDGQGMGECNRLTFTKNLMTHEIIVIVSCATSAGQSVGRVVSAHFI